MSRTFTSEFWSGGIRNVDGIPMVAYKDFCELKDCAREMQSKIDSQNDHIKALQDELAETQAPGFDFSDQIVIQRDAEPIDIAAALINSDWINLGDLQEIAEHLQATYKNSWGE